jgi:hypothetical protein
MDKISDLPDAVVMQFEQTPEALANFSPGFELVRTLGKLKENARFVKSLWIDPRVVASLQPRAKFSQHLRC